MKAVGYQASLPVSDANALVDIELPDPQAMGRDLLVEVKAVSVNPVDTKMRMKSAPAPGESHVLGWDVSGVVKSVGPDVELFKVGDEVWYAGAIDRPGCNSELHLVDERIVSAKPASLTHAQAAAMPLTSITAWELLFDRLGIPQDMEDRCEALLIVGAAGGVGSIMTQLARQLTGLTVIGTASREETTDWVLKNGAHYVIDHSKPLSEGLEEIAIPKVSYVASLTKTDQHLEELVECLVPQGKFALIDDPEFLDIKLLKRKSISLHWEFMYTRSMYQTVDMIEQHNLLEKVAGLVDEGCIKTTQQEHYGSINAENLKRAHAQIESGTTIGKIVLEGF